MSDIIFIDDVRVVFDLEAVGRKLNLRARSSAKMEKILLEMAEEAQTIARPRAAAKLSHLSPGEEDDEVRLDGVLLTSSLLKEKLADLGRAFPHLATEGTELAEWGRAYEGMERILANALQNSAMAMARQRLEEAILEKYSLEQISAMNPGSLLAWPITEQEPLFELLAPLPEQLGDYPAAHLHDEAGADGFRHLLSDRQQISQLSALPPGRLSQPPGSLRGRYVTPIFSLL